MLFVTIVVGWTEDFYFIKRRPRYGSDYKDEGVRLCT